MDWDHLRFVLAVADAGGLSGAARALGVDAATVSRRLDALEAQLRCKLFHRTRAGLAPNSAGTKLIEHARRIDGEVRALAFELAPEDRGLGGTVIVTATEAIAAAVLAPALPEFHRRHPAIAIEIATDIRALDLSRREADIALRLLMPTQRELKVRRLAAVRYALYASPGYLAAHGTPARDAALDGHRLIDWPLPYTVIPQVPWLRARADKAAVVLRSNSAMVRLAAAASGAGIAMLPRLLGDGDARLVALASDEPPRQDLYLATHRDLAAVPRIRTTLDFLAEAVRRTIKGPARRG